MAKKNANGDQVDDHGRVIVAAAPGPVKKDAKGDVVTAVATRPEPAVPAVRPALEGGSWGSEGVDASDILIPKLLLMQPLSRFVGDERAQAGDIVKSTTGKKVENCRMIPLSTFKTWVEEEQIGSKFEYRQTVPMTAANADAPLEWEDAVTKTKWQRSRVLNFFVLLSDDIVREAAARKAFADDGEIPDTDDVLIPHLVCFRRTSYRAGRELVTHFTKAAQMNLPPASKQFDLKVKKEKGDKGTYYVFDLVPAEKTPREYLPIARHWYELVKTNKVKVHDDLDDVVVVEEAAAVPADEYKGVF